MKRTPLPTIRSCDDCGACCTEQEQLPLVLIGERFRLPGVAPLPDWLATELRAELERFQRDGWPTPGGPCLWYDPETRRCRHYEYRPVLCRDGVKVGDEACRKWRRGAGIDPTPKYRLSGGRLVREG